MTYGTYGYKDNLNMASHKDATGQSLDAPTWFIGLAVSCAAGCLLGIGGLVALALDASVVMGGF